MADNGDFIDILLFALGIVLAPAWGIWTARLLAVLDMPRELTQGTADHGFEPTERVRKPRR
jgi:hypothetical protein